MRPDKTRVVILGGGFGGIYTALRLEKTLRRSDDIEVTLINGDNFFLFTPMLHEVAASDLDPTHIVNPIRKLIRRANFLRGRVTGVDWEAKVVQVEHGDDGHGHEVPYDHLVIGLGSVSNHFGLPGVADHAFDMKSIDDAISLRSRLIECLETADTECACELRRELLTIVVAGGGFAGIETAASVHDFLSEAKPFYGNLRSESIRVQVIHAGEEVLPELGPALGGYARKKLEGRGVEVFTSRKVASFTGRVVTLDDGTSSSAATLIWTAGTSTHPLIRSLDLPKERGRIAVDATFRVPGHEGVWALGDAAAVPGCQGSGFCPPTAQDGGRQRRILADNVVAAIRGRGEPRPFRFRALGQLASLGHRTGVARILGCNFSGFLAWWLWRTVYLFKLPRIEKKLRVMLDWTLDLFFSKDLVQFQGAPRHSASPPPRELMASARAVGGGS